MPARPRRGTPQRICTLLLAWLLLLPPGTAWAGEQQREATAAPMCVQTPGVSGACSIVHYFGSPEEGIPDFLTEEPARRPSAAQPEERAAVRQRPSYEEMAGQMIMVGFRGTGEDPRADDLPFILADVAAGRVGGVILFERDHITKIPGRNIRSLPQVARLTALLQAAAPHPLFVGVDQEGGRVRRFKEEHGVVRTPAASELGLGTPDATHAEALKLGRVLSSVGINVNFAPSLDVDVNPESPAIGALGRSFSGDTEQVAQHGLAFARGLWRAGVVPCYKHFPGHGSASGDTHLGLTDISSSWSEAELEPYRAVLPQSPPAMVMPGHMVHRKLAGEVPASLSAEITGALLRGELGWKGVVISDDLQMQAVGGHFSVKEAMRLAVEAGADILLFGNNLAHDPEEGRKAHALLLELVYEGRLSPERLYESYERIMELKKQMQQNRALQEAKEADSGR